MRQKSKKLLSFLLALVLLAGLVPGLTPGMSLTALAADGSETFDSFQRGVNEYRGTHIKCVSTDAYDSAGGGLYVGGSSNDTITVSSLNGEIITKVEITNSFPTDTTAYDIGNVVIDGAAKTVDGIKSATFSNLNVSSAVIKTEGGAIGIWVSSVKVYYSEPVAVPHEHDGVTFQPWDSADSLPSEAGNYYLTQDVRLSSGLEITGSEINLCLNGHTISTSFTNTMVSTIPSAIWLKSGAVLRIYDEGGGTIRNNSSKPVKKGGAIHVETGCTLHLYGGAISGYRAEWGGGVIVYGTMYMYGGEITGNTATNGGGGIELESGGILYLYGGSVTGNNVANQHSDLYKGGGIHVPSGSAFYLKGSVTVRDNTDGSGAANNVFLRSELVITVAGPLTNTTPIGVLTQQKIESGVKSIPLTSVLNGDGAASNFVSDDSAYKVILENDKAYLVLASGDVPSPTPAQGVAQNVQTGTIYETLQASLDAAADGETVKLLKGVTEDVTFSKSATVTLDLNGNGVTGTGSDSVLRISDGTLNLTDSGNGGCITGGKGFTGGGVTITSGATFNMDAGTISGNESEDGAGGVFISDGTFNMSGAAVISGNKGPNGGVYVNNGELFNMSGGEIRDNTATSRGGGVCAQGSFNMTGGSITGNVCDGYGGGGGVNVNGGSFDMSGGSITGNKSDFGGGVYMTQNAAFKLSKTVNVTGNTKKDGSTANNVYLGGRADGGYAKLSPGATGATMLDPASRIGITHGGGKGVFTTGVSADYAEKYKAVGNFFDDTEKYAVLLADETEGDLKLDEESGGEPETGGATLTFYKDSEGTLLSTHKVPAGDSLAAYANTTVSVPEATFAGWSTVKGQTSYADKNGNVTAQGIVDLSTATMPAEGLTLFPILVHDRLAVVLVPGEDAVMGEYAPGSVQSTGFTVDLNEKLTMTGLDGTTRPGYTLTGWTTQNGTAWNGDWGVTPEYCDKDGSGNPIVQTNTARKYNYYTVTLTAQWAPAEVPVRFVTGEGTLSPVPSVTTALGGSFTLPVPTPPDGKVFDHWTDAKGGSHSGGEAFRFADWSLVADDALTFTAVYSDHAENELIFDTDGGSYVAPVTGAAGTPVTAPENPTRTGYEFAGWDREIPATLPAGTTVIKALWTINRYTITFNTNGGSAVAPLTLNYNAAVAAPAAPTKEHYDFDGWSPALPSNMPAENLTVSAQWKPREYTLTYKLTEDDPGAVIRGVYDSVVEKPADPVREGYVFTGWSPEFPTHMPGDNPVIMATWEKLAGKAEVYAVLQNADGTWTAPAASSENLNADSYAIPDRSANHFHAAAYTLGSFAESPAARTAVKAGDVIALTGEFDRVYIYYERASATLTYYSDTAGTQVLKTLRVRFGEPLEAYLAETVSAEHQTFAGWSTEKDQRSYANKAGVVTAKGLIASTDTVPAEGLALYPVLVPDRLNVRLDLGAADAYNTNAWFDAARYDSATPGHMAETQARDFTVDLDEKISMDALNAATRDGYVLSGWHTQDGTLWNAGWGVTQEFCDKENGNPVLKTNEARKYNYYTVTLTANWTPAEVPVRFDPAEGTLSPVPSVTTALGGSFTLPTPQAPDGMLFDDWMDANGGRHAGGESFHFTDWTLVRNGALSFTAVYRARPENVILFDTDGGSYVEPITENVGDPVTRPKDPVREGCTFDGWEPELPATMPANELTVKAKWKLNRYTITFNTNGGSAVPSITLDFGAKISAPADPAREHFEFRSWHPALPETMPAGDLTLTAQWSPREYTLTYKLTEDDPGTAIRGIFDSPIQKPADPVREGYSFTGWSPAFPSHMPGEDLTVIAQWRRETAPGAYTVTYHANYGTGSIPAQSATDGERVAVASPDGVSRAGYAFDRWNTAADGSGTDYAPGSEISTGAVLYAQWTPNSYTLNLNAAGGSVTPESVSLTYDGDAFTLPTPTRTGFVFAGWAAGADSNAVSYVGGQQVKNLAESGSVTLYALWTETAYEVATEVESRTSHKVDIQLKRGNALIAEKKDLVPAEKDGGGYSVSSAFEDIPAGIYNVVVTQTNAFGKTVTVTTSVLVTDSDVTVPAIILPSADANSVLEVKGEDTRPVVVSGLEEEASAKEEDGKSVTITMTVEKQEEAQLPENATEAEKETQEAIAGIKAQAEPGDVLEFMNIDVEKTTENMDASGNVTDTQTEAVHQTSTVIEIVIPYDMTGKANIQMYRWHSGNAVALMRNNSRTDGTFRLDKLNHLVYLYANRFSTYAISYVEGEEPDTYSVTVVNGSGSGEYAEGETVTVRADAAPRGQTFSRWVSTDGVSFADARSAMTTFVMPAQNVTVTASYRATGGGSTGGGSGSRDRDTGVTAVPAAPQESKSASPEDTGVADWLNCDAHTAYLNGYEDGTIRPQGSITRAETAMIFYRLLKNKDAAAPKSFTDVPAEAWFARAVGTLSGLGILNGYEDGTFRPNNPITRAEFTAIATRFAKAADGKASFADVPEGYWAAPNIATAAAYGWVNGKGDNLFAPMDNITRAETAAIVNRMLGRAADGEKPAATSKFNDLKDPEKWYYLDLREASDGTVPTETKNAK